MSEASRTCILGDSFPAQGDEDRACNMLSTDMQVLLFCFLSPSSKLRNALSFFAYECRLAMPSVFPRHMSSPTSTFNGLSTDTYDIAIGVFSEGRQTLCTPYSSIAEIS